MNKNDTVREEFGELMLKSAHCEDDMCFLNLDNIFSWIQEQIKEGQMEILDRMKERMDKEKDWEGETWHAYEQIRLEQEFLNDNDMAEVREARRIQEKHSPHFKYK